MDIVTLLGAEGPQQGPQGPEGPPSPPQELEGGARSTQHRTSSNIYKRKISDITVCTLLLAQQKIYQESVTEVNKVVRSFPIEVNAGGITAGLGMRKQNY